MNEETILYQEMEVPGASVMVPIRGTDYGHVADLPDEELLTGAELERMVYLQEYGPILALPRPKQACFFRANGFDDNGKPDFGAFGTVDFERYSGGINKRLYKVDRLKDRLKDKNILFEIINERLGSIEKYTVLKLLRASIIDLEHIADSDMYDLATVFLQICRLTSEIIELQKKAWAKKGATEQLV